MSMAATWMPDSCAKTFVPTNGWFPGLWRPENRHTVSDRAFILVQSMPMSLP